MDTPKKPQASDEEAAPPPAPPAPPPSARSPFLPLSRRRREQQLARPVPAVERPDTSLVFDASPTTIAAALAKAGDGTPFGPSRLTWGRRTGAAAPVADREVDSPPDRTA